MPVTMIFWDFFTKFRKLPHVRAFFWLLVEVNINFFKKKKTKKVIRCLERRFEAEFRVHPKGVDEEFRQMNSEIAKNKMRNLAGFIPELPCKK